ncbi:MAG: 4-diphosphocytidyl-2C-methyl-D-erythritol kinase [Rhodospirillales bacterium]|nr:4-diphosphocytidyl-2C-methyl-D-erythritol kinase [Rhodospirillales bacterium]
MIRQTAEALLSSAVRPVLVVTGHEAEDIKAALAELPVSFHHAPDFAEGMSASLKAGIAAVPEGCDAALICLGDMPFVRAQTFDQAAQAYNPTSGWMALFPTFQGKRGNPVLLARPLFAEIMRLKGDQGARALLASIPERVGEIVVDDPGVLRDIDHPNALSA